MSTAALDHIRITLFKTYVKNCGKIIKKNSSLSNTIFVMKILLHEQKAVEEEYRNWASMNNENDIIAHFSVPGTPSLFLCLLWKMIMETDRISPIAYK